MKSIPKLLSFGTPKEKYYEIAEENKLLRLGVKANTPTVCNWACPYCYAGNSNTSDRPKTEENCYYNGMDPYKDKDWANKMKSWRNQC